MNNFTLVNLDTDSISFCKVDQSSFTEEEQINLLNSLNNLYPPKIRWEHDGVFETVCILKAKNYVLKSYVCKNCKKLGLSTCNHEYSKITKKGSSLKSSKTEPALKDFMSEIINTLLNDQMSEIVNIYNKYVLQIHNLKDIAPWCSKKTVTQSVLNPERTNEQKVLDALKGRSVQMGDKIYTYFTEQKEIIEEERTTKRGTNIVKKEIVTNPLKLKEDWSAANPDHSVDLLLKRLYNTIMIFENVINFDSIPKYHLKTNKHLLDEMLINNNFKKEVEKIIK